MEENIDESQSCAYKRTHGYNTPFVMNCCHGAKLRKMGELEEHFINIYLRRTLPVTAAIKIHDHAAVYCSCTLHLYLD